MKSVLHSRIFLLNCLCRSLGAVAMAFAATAASAQVTIAPIEKDASAARSAADKSPARPSFDELWKKLAEYELAYFPFRVKEVSTMRMGDGLSPEERARYPWGDGRKHGHLMEYAQKADRFWLRKETHTLDDKPGDVHSEWYSDGTKSVQLTLWDAARREPAQAHVERDPHRIAPWQWASPLRGVFPLACFSDGGLMTRAFQDRREEVRLDWEDGDARLTFDFGPDGIRTRFMLWLSHEHDWHPAKLRRYMPADAAQFFDEWVVTKFVREEDRWRVSQGTIRYHDRKDIKSPEAKVMYATDFKVSEAEWGHKLPDSLFEYDIPKDAEIHDPKRPMAETPPANHGIAIHVVDILTKPVGGANVLFHDTRTPREFDRAKSDEKGAARSNKLPDQDVGVQIEADGFRVAEWVAGRGANEFTVILAPSTRGLMLDDGGSLLPGVWITSRPIAFRVDGLPHPPHGYGIHAPDRSDERGRFELKESLTLRSADGLVALIAIDQSLERMAIRFLSPPELGERQTILLKPVCEIRAACLLEKVAEPLELATSIVAENGRPIGYLPGKTSLTAAGLQVEFHFRLPPGRYSLQSRQSSRSPAFTLPVSVVANQRRLDLGTTTVAASGTVALAGKPAPDIAVRWHDGQTWPLDKLRGRIVVLDFWGTWCGPCVEEMPFLTKIAEKFRGEPVEWLAVHTPSAVDFDEFDRQLTDLKHRFWQDRSPPFQQVIDESLADGGTAGKTAHRYGVVTWPTTIIIDQAGMVVGAVAREDLAATIRRLLTGQPDD